jgi:hypothetical protein
MIELMIDANDDDEYDQALCALTRSMHEFELVDEVESSIGPDLLRRMHSDLDNEKLQERLTDILRDLDKHTKRVHSVIKYFVESHPEDASVARFGFELIRYGDIEFDCADYYDQIYFLVETMICHEKDPGVQEYAMHWMGDILRDGDEVDEIEETDALHACLQAMRNHPDISDVQQEACDILPSFKFQLIIRQEWPPATILQALNNHVHCAGVQVTACHCLCDLLEQGETEIFEHGRDYFETILESPVGEDFFIAGRDYIEAILQAMRTHPTNEKVQGAALQVLGRMTDESASLNPIIKGGGVDLVVQAIKIVKGTACLWAGMILKALFACSTDARRNAIELGVIPILLNVMRHSKVSKHDYVIRYETTISCCGAVCATLNELFLENLDRVVSIQIANEGGIKLIVDAIGKYATPLSLPEDGEILAHLAMFLDDDGKLPLHYAADRGKESHKTGRMAVLEHLLKVYPEAATVTGEIYMIENH